MSLTLLIILLAFVWATITGGFTLPNLLLGAVVALVAGFLLRDRLAAPAYLGRAGKILSLAGLFLYELGLSAVRVAALVLSPNLRDRLKPAIVAYPLTVRSNGEITLLANLITLTPGTLSLDVSDDHKILYIHVLSMKDRHALIAEIAAGFEARVMEVFK